MPKFQNPRFRRQIARYRAKNILKAAERIALDLHTRCTPEMLLNPLNGEHVLCIRTNTDPEHLPLVALFDAAFDGDRAKVEQYDVVIPLKPIVDEGVMRRVHLVWGIDQHSGPIGTAFRNMVEDQFSETSRADWEAAMLFSSKNVHIAMAVVDPDLLSA